MSINDNDWLRKSAMVERDLNNIRSEADQFEFAMQSIKQNRNNPFAAKDKIHKLTVSARQLCTEILALEKLVQDADNWSGTERKQKVRNLHQAALKEFQRIQRLSSALHSEYERAQRSKTDSSAVKFPSHPQSKPAPPMEENPLEMFSIDDQPVDGFGQLQFSQITDDNATQQLDQERAMRQLENDINQVNEVFTTLATLVHDQGDLVDSIEANTESAYMQVTVGTENLAQARRSRNKARRRRCCCISVIVVAVIVVILIIVFSTVNFS